MLNAFFELKGPLEYIDRNSANNEFHDIFLSSTDWIIVEELRNLFNIFVKPSVKLQGEVYVTLPKGLLYIYQIYNNLEAFINKVERKIQEREDLVSFHFIFIFYAF